MTTLEDFANRLKISLKSHLLEGEADIRAGRIKEYNAEILDKMTQEAIDEEKLPKIQKY